VSTQRINAPDPYDTLPFVLSFMVTSQGVGEEDARDAAWLSVGHAFAVGMVFVGLIFVGCVVVGALALRVV
jgi:hypothetical protein